MDAIGTVQVAAATEDAGFEPAPPH
jgi:hypothetical protein